MKQKNRQSGSVHAIIIAVLFLALMASLGVVFYQNFIAPNSTTSDLPAEQTPHVVATDTEQIAFASSIYEIDRPENWKFELETVDGARADGSKMTFTSPDKNIRVLVSIVEELPQGVPCAPAPERKVSYYTVHTTNVMKLTGTPVYLVEAISDMTGGGYTYQIGLTPDGGSTHSSVGESDCTITRIGYVADAVMNDKTMQPSIRASIHFPNLLGKDEKVVKSMQPIKDMLDTSEYKTAVKILESARKK